MDQTHLGYNALHLELRVSFNLLDQFLSIHPVLLHNNYYAVSTDPGLIKLLHNRTHSLSFIHLVGDDNRDKIMAGGITDQLLG